MNLDWPLLHLENSDNVDKVGTYFLAHLTFITIVDSFLEATLWILIIIACTCNVLVYTDMFNIPHDIFSNLKIP